MNHRILVVDDNAAIHEDIRKILAPPKATSALLGVKRRDAAVERESLADGVAPSGHAFPGPVRRTR